MSFKPPANTDWITATPGTGCGAGSIVKYRRHGDMVTIAANVRAGGTNGGTLIAGGIPSGFRIADAVIDTTSRLHMVWDTTASVTGPVDIRTDGSTFVWLSGHATSFQITYLAEPA